MQKSLRKSNILLKTINNLVVDFPSPSNISIMWNFGSLAGLCLAVQILTGLFLTMFYTSDITTSFTSVDHIMRNVNHGWLMRLIHSNGASLMFICLHIHMGRSMYYMLFLKSNHVWESGVMIFIMTMATAFFGYILPWGQMSFWGATVITSLFSAFPFIGESLVQWIWGGFSVDCPTLTRFFALHFLCPFLIIMLMIIHLIFLHLNGSSNPLGIKSNYDKITFHLYFSMKDMVGFLLIMLILMMVSTMYPYITMEPDNFLPANPLSTPTHIQPEWYFLFAYAILRSIPNKLGGVIALILSLIIFLIMPMLYSNIKELKSSLFLMKILFWVFANIFIILTWIGMCPVEQPYEMIGKIFSILYFSYFFIPPMIMNLLKK